METADESPPSTRPDGAGRMRAGIGAMLGGTLEWYDFTIYGILALYISGAIFPTEHGDAALFATFILFGVSFISRPFGGILLGGYSDRHGRKPALLASIALMAAATFAIAFIPSYAAIGVAAPLLLLLARLLQGLSAGGEFGTANSFLVEWSTPNRRGLWGSLLSTTVALGSVLANAVAAIVIVALSPEQMSSWGWRIPFVVGGVLGLIVLWMRVGLDETPVFRDAKHQRATIPEVVLRDKLRRGLIVFGLTIYWTVCFYIFMIYMPTYTRMHAELTSAQAVFSNMLAAVLIAVLNPLFGGLSDRYGRRPFLLASCALVIVLTLPAFWLIAAVKSFALVVLVQAGFGIAIALYSGPCPALFAELFPTRSRSSWPSVAYALGVAVFGGFAPSIAIWLTHAFDSPVAPAAYVLSAAAVSLAVLLSIRETAHAPITDGREPAGAPAASIKVPVRSH